MYHDDASLVCSITSILLTIHVHNLDVASNAAQRLRFAEATSRHRIFALVRVLLAPVR